MSIMNFFIACLTDNRPGTFRNKVVFKTLSKIYDEAFLRKQLIPKSFNLLTRKVQENSQYFFIISQFSVSKEDHSGKLFHIKLISIVSLKIEFWMLMI